MLTPASKRVSNEGTTRLHASTTAYAFNLHNPMRLSILAPRELKTTASHTSRIITASSLIISSKYK